MSNRTFATALRSLALSVLALVGVASAAEAATLRVPQHYATIQNAVDAANPGDIVRIGSGTYAGFSISNRQGIRVRGGGGHSITGSVSVDSSQGIELRGLRLSGRDISVSTSVAVGVARCRIIDGGIIGLDSDSLLVERNRLEGAGPGILVSNTTALRIYRNRVIDTAGTGIDVDGPGEIRGNKVTGASVHSGAIRGVGSGGLRIIRNRVQDVGGPGILLLGSDISVERNEVFDTGTHGIQCTGAGSNRIIRNNVKRTSNDGIKVEGTCNDNEIDGNRVRDLSSDGIDLQSTGNIATGNRINRAGAVGIEINFAGNTVTGNSIRNVGEIEIRDDVGGSIVAGNNCPQNPGNCP